MTTARVADPEDLARVEGIARYAVLGVPPRRDLQALVALAAQICDVPQAVINLITSTRARSSGSATRAVVIARLPRHLWRM